MDVGLPATCFTHDTQAYDSLTVYTATERGPPVASIGASVSAVQPPIDSRSRCSLAPSPAAAAFVVYHYDYRAKPAQGAKDSASTAASQSGSARDLSSLQHSGVAAKSGEEGLGLFRHVSPGELSDIGKNGFRAGPGSLDGKWFAESGEHASEWGRLLNGGEGAVVKVRVPTSFSEQLMRLEKLDGIGPARYVDPPQLGELNQYPRELWR